MKKKLKILSNMSVVLTIAAAAFLVMVLPGAVHADYAGAVKADKESVKQGFKKPGYSPYAGRNFPNKVLWGDTHLHTNLSLDARAFGVTLGPEEAYRLARGEEITTSHGERIKLSRPLDWLVVTDHSDAMGAMNEIIAGNPDLMREPVLKDWHDRLKQGGDTALAATMEIIETFAGVSGEKIPDIIMAKNFVGSVWERYLETAEKYNEPGRFTTIIGYEWTSTENGNNLHRNVLYRGGADEAKQMLPFTAAESFNPEDLWKWMAAFEDKSGGRVFALAHNGNVSNGLMFPEINPVTGKPLTKAYAETRIRWEPIYEVTQIKVPMTSLPATIPCGIKAILDRFSKSLKCINTNMLARRSKSASSKKRNLALTPTNSGW
jgi:hypothetical protein